jgi:RNA polymerase sigma-70 factor (ECF subfamily)
LNRIDTQRLSDLVATHGAALRLYARQWCPLPDDALQEALIDLLRQDPAPDHPVAWLYVAVRRRAMNLARAEQRRTRHYRQAAEGCEPWFCDDAGAPLAAADLERLLARLDALDREIVVARVWGELSFEQIADVVDRSTTVVHRRYQRALAKLGDLMRDTLDALR